MHDVRLAGEKLLREHGIRVPPLKKISPWPDLDEPMRIELDWYRRAKPLLQKVLAPTLKDLQEEWLEINPKCLIFVDHPVLGVPYPIDTGHGPEVEERARLFPADGEDYWQWVGYIEEKGLEVAQAAGISVADGSPPSREYIGNPCYRLWWSVTWYEDIYLSLTGTRDYSTPTLIERDREMAEKIRDKARAHVEDVETLLAIIERKNKEIADLKGLLDKIKAICGPA